MRKFTRAQLTRLRRYVAEEINYIAQWAKHPDKERFDPDGSKAFDMAELEEILSTIDELRENL